MSMRQLNPVYFSICFEGEGYYNDMHTQAVLLCLNKNYCFYLT